MSERVSVIEGKLPVILVSPHCDTDDYNLGLLTEHAAWAINCYAVINRGWKKSDQVDFWTDQGDCNRVIHCHENVVKQEFLDPILRYKNRILRDHKKAFIFFLHGMSNKHRKLSNEENLDLVVGYGAGKPNSYTCELWRKNAFVDRAFNAGFTTMQGRKGGRFSGWARNNMNQLFRKHYNDKRVDSMQIEIIYELREDKEIVQLTGEYLAGVIEECIEMTGFKSDYSIPEY